MKYFVNSLIMFSIFSISACMSVTFAVQVDDILDDWSKKGTGGNISIVADPEDETRQAYRMRLMTSMPGPRFRSEVNSRLEDIVATSYSMKFRIMLMSHDPTTQGISLTQFSPMCWVHIRLRERDGYYVISVSDVDVGAEDACVPPSRLSSETVIDEHTFGPINYDEWVQFKLQGIADGVNSWVRLKQFVLGEWIVIYAWTGTLNRETPAEWHFGMYTGANPPAENYEAHFQILGYDGMESF